MATPAGTTGKGKPLSWQSRPCPADFDIIFVEMGRFECEAHYRARRTTITRWLEERGKARLLKRRALFVKYQSDLKRRTKSKPNGAAIAPKDRRRPDPKLVEIAGRFLQSPNGGGWVAYACDCGNWIVGTRRISPAEVIDMAERKGFNKRRALEQIRAFAEQN